MQRLFPLMTLCTTLCLAQTMVAPGLKAGREAIAARDYSHARELFATYIATHPKDAQGFFGEGEADLGLHRYEAAERDDRQAVALEPELWIAHKDLVVIEAKLGRWEEFDRERALLRGAREREAPGITKRESDIIDSFDINGAEWVVREYFEPVGRSQARYNFEHFAAGKAAAYVSLEPASAAASALKRDDVHIGSDTPTAAPTGEWSLNWYTGSGHGTVHKYPKGEPKYETVRADAQRWLRSKSHEQRTGAPG